MPDFAADLNQLKWSANAWDNACLDLKAGATKCQEIEYSNREVVWSLFQDTWDANLKAVRYTEDRLNEGSVQMDEMSNALDHVANVLMEQDANFAGLLIKISED